MNQLRQAQTAMVFVQADIASIVKFIFDSPVAANDVEQALGIGLFGARVAK